MSAIDIGYQKQEDPKGDRVVVIMNKVLPYKSGKENGCYCCLLPTPVCDRTTIFGWRDALLFDGDLVVIDY
jgi:hypothetical protein